MHCLDPMCVLVGLRWLVQPVSVPVHGLGVGDPEISHHMELLLYGIIVISSLLMLEDQD